jgi:hypothetical protein
MNEYNVLPPPLSCIFVSLFLIGGQQGNQRERMSVGVAQQPLQNAL